MGKKTNKIGVEEKEKGRNCKTCKIAIKVRLDKNGCSPITGYDFGISKREKWYYYCPLIKGHYSESNLDYYRSNFCHEIIPFHLIMEGAINEPKKD